MEEYCSTLSPRWVRAGIALLLLNPLFVSSFSSPTSASPTIELSGYRLVEIAPTEFTVAGVAFGDIDGDGNLDLLASTFRSAMEQDEHIRVHRGDGSGNFVEQAPTWAWTRPRQIVTADFDGDGHLDYVVADDRREDIIVRLGNGDFTFPRNRLLPSEGSPAALVVEDFNGDDLPDIASANPDPGSVSVFLNRGDGTFHNPRHLAADGEANSLTVGDFDEDGLDDLACANGTDDSLTVFFGNGAGGFPTSSTLSFALNRSPKSIRSGDWDEDGHLDLLAVHDLHELLTVHFGDGTGAFPIVREIELPSEPSSLVLSDMDSDSHLDAAVGLRDGDLLVAFGAAKRSVRTEVMGNIGDGVYAFLTALDLDGDRFPELLTGGELLIGGRESNFLFVLPGAGRGGPVAPLGSSGGGPAQVSVAAGDLDEDGVLDLVSAHRSAAFLSFHRGDGTGRFWDDLPPIFLDSLTPSDLDVALSDLDLDRHLDLIVRVSIPDQDDVLARFLGDGSGGFGPGLLFSLGTEAGSGLVVADFDEDGFPDVALPASPLLTVILLSSDGVGGFLPPVSHPGSGSNPVVGDWNQDNHLDLALLQADANRIEILLGDGQGGFSQSLLDPALGISTLGQLHAADTDQDGRTDLVSIGFSNFGADRQIQTWRGNGDGTFLSPVSGNLTNDVSRIVIADLDEDGRVDLAGDDGRKIFVGASDAMGGFEALRTFGGTDHETSRLLAEDFDGDTHRDLLLVTDRRTSGFTEARFTFVRNRSFDALDCRKGNVNLGAGPIVDVLKVNASIGDPEERIVHLSATDPLTIQIEAPPMMTKARYVVWAAAGVPSNDRLEVLPRRLGRVCFRTPITGGRVEAIWNTLGFEPVLGEATFPSTEAPSTLLDIPQVGMSARFILQGLVQDPGALGGSIAVTNAVVVDVE